MTATAMPATMRAIIQPASSPPAVTSTFAVVSMRAKLGGGGDRLGGGEKTTAALISGRVTLSTVKLEPVPMSVEAIVFFSNGDANDVLNATSACLR